MADTVVAYGEILWDLLPSGAVLGGAPFNLAFRVNTLGDRALMISRLGEDELGRRAVQIAAGLGMDTAFLQRDRRRPTGTVEVFLDQNKVPDFTILPGVAYDFIEPEEDLIELVRRADCLCFGTLVQRSARSRRTLWKLLQSFRGRLLLLDINLRRDCYTAATIRASIERADVLKLNDAEAEVLAGIYGTAQAKAESGGPDLAALTRTLFARSSLKLVVVTLGELGSLAVSRQGERVYSPAYAVEPLDTVGSGDAFGAALVHALLRGWTLERACAYGNAFGALVATQPGATQPLAPAEIEEFCRTAPRRPADPLLSRYLVSG